MTQKDKVLELLQNLISPLEALQSAGCFRLAAVVHQLRKEGHDIADKWHFSREFKMVVVQFEIHDVTKL
jgi:hypothetical protein